MPIEVFSGLQDNALELTQSFEGITLSIGRHLQWRKAEVQPCLDIEEEQQAVHAAQGSEGERLLVDRAALDASARDSDDLIAEDFDRLAHSSFERGRDRIRVTVRFFGNP